MRLPLLLLATMLLAGCGSEAPESTQPADAGVTLELPPAIPAEKGEAPAPAAAEEMVALDDTAAENEANAAQEPQAAEPRLVSASPPIAQASLARYITRAGFSCDEVVTVTQLEQPDGSRAGIYKFDCSAGGDYQGTMKQGHLYFRPWEGIPN